MKILTLLLFILFAVGCNLNKSNKQSENGIKDTNNNKVRQHAESLLAGENGSSLESGLLQAQMFDSINSPIDSTRAYYLHVAKFLMKRGDALFSGQLGLNLITFIKDRPREFIESFSKSGDNEIRNLGTNIGAYIANYVPTTEEETNNIEEILSKNIQVNIPIEANFKRKIMPIILETAKALNHRNRK